MRHAVGGSAPVSWQRDPATLRQLEQQRARRHVFKLPDGVAPVPERGQLPAQPVAAPLGMLRQERPHLRQFQRPDLAALDRGKIGHAAQFGRWACQSPEQEGTIFLSPNPSQMPPIWP